MNPILIFGVGASEEEILSVAKEFRECALKNALQEGLKGGP